MHATKSATVLFAAVILALDPISPKAEDPTQALMPQSIADVVEAVRPSFVNILVKGIVTPESGQSANVPHMTDIVGSGVIVDATGIIFTNNHVVDNAYELRVQLSDGTILPARLLGKGKQLDVALIKLDVDRPLPIARVGDSDRVRVGDRVFAMGNPLGLSGSVTSGIVSAVDRDVRGAPYNYIQTDTPVNHGNSGGPLFNLHGEVIGINQQIFSDTKGGGSIGLAFAIPTNDLIFLFRQIRDYGRPRLGTIGVGVQAVTQNIASALHLPDVGGALVAEVGDPAESAGIKVGDIIMTMNGTKIANQRQLIRAIGESAVGTKVQLGVWSAGSVKTVSVDAQLLSQDLWDSYKSTTVQEPRFTKISDFGMGLSDLTPELRKEHNVGPALNGPLVNSVVSEGAAANASLNVGDVIQKVGLSSISTVEDFTRLMTQARDSGNRDILLLVGGARGSWWTTLPLQM
jgi:serine protease Do